MLGRIDNRPWQKRDVGWNVGVGAAGGFLAGFEHEGQAQPVERRQDVGQEIDDPDGMDIWNINENGGIQYVKNTKKDQINIVNSDGIKKSSIEFKYGTIHNKEMKYQDEKGNEKNMTFLNITGDNNGKKVFEFLANGTKVEWGHLKVGKSDGEKGENLIATGSSETSKENANESSNAAGAVVKGYGYNIREFNHNHPNGTLPSNSDINLRDKYPGTKLNVYTDGHYIPYTTTADLMRIAYLEALRENGVKIY